MKVQIIPFKTIEQEKFKEARLIRQVVFIEEQKVEERDEFDAFEDESYHYLLRVNDNTIGTARWRVVGNKVKLERFAVLKAYRGQKYGELLLKRVIEDAKKEKKPMYLHAQLKAVPFYGRQGFEKVGDLFVECDIEHYKMEMGVNN